VEKFRKDIFLETLAFSHSLFFFNLIESLYFSKNY